MKNGEPRTGNEVFLWPSNSPFSVPRSPFFISHPELTKISLMTTDPSFLRRRPLRRFLRHWLERHQHPFNFGIHLIGIPLAFAGLTMFFTIPWPWALAAFLSGYALQWTGHRVERND